MRTVPGTTDRIVVIGAGLGGLSAALHLAGAGREVTVLERAAEPGGRAGVLRSAGYTFDTGPTVLTMPDLLEQTFNAVGEKSSNWLTLQQLDPAYRATFADGSQLNVHSDPAAMVQEIAQVCGPYDAGGYLRFIRYLRELYELEMPHFIERNLDSPLALNLPSLLALARLGGLRRLAPKVASFVRDERLRRIFTFQSMYAGLAPTQALALYSIITYMDCVAGVYFPIGGMHAVPRALAGAAEKHGVQFRYNCSATRIETSGRRAAAVVTESGERIEADTIVVNADLPTAYRELLPDARQRKLRYSPSCVVLHIGADGQTPTAHHTISFGQSWEQTFAEVIDDGSLMSDPSFLLTCPTATDSTLAPAGRSTYYALFPAPNLDQPTPIDWHEQAGPYREQMLTTIESRLAPGLRDRIETIHTVTPDDWRAQGIAAGAPFGATHDLRQTGPFRPPTLDRQYENIVFCGTNTQPGVGIPMVLISGRLAAARITGNR
jgi:phytoene desaturase